MPAAYLLRSTAALHRNTVATHGESTVRDGGTYAWFPATEGSTAYTVPIPGSVMPSRRRGVVVKGLTSMETGEIALACLSDDLPFIPIPNETTFIVAVAEDHGDEFDPAAERKRYVVTEINERIPGSTSLRILASLNA